MFFPDPARGLFEFHRVLAPGGWMAVSVTTVPDRSLFARIGAVVARYATESAEKLNRFFSIPDPSRMRALIASAEPHDIDAQLESRSIAFNSSAAPSAAPKTAQG